MSRRPNLKPKSLTTHIDKADRLGVPRSNVVDLRAQQRALENTQPEAAAVPAEQKMGWLQRRKIAKQQKQLARARRRELKRTTATEEYTAPVAGQPVLAVQQHPVAIVNSEPELEVEPVAATPVQPAVEVPSAISAAIQATAQEAIEEQVVPEPQLQHQNEQPYMLLDHSELPAEFIPDPLSTEEAMSVHAATSAPATDLLQAVYALEEELEESSSPEPAQVPTETVDHIEAELFEETIEEEWSEATAEIPAEPTRAEQRLLAKQAKQAKRRELAEQQATAIAEEREAALAERLAKQEAKQTAKEAALAFKEEQRAERAQLKADRKAARAEYRDNLLSSAGVPWVQSLKSLSAFMVVCAVLISPFASTAFYKHVSSIRGEVIEVSQGAVEHFSVGTRQVTDLDFATAQQSFASAETDFQEAGDELVIVNDSLTPLLKAVPELGGQYTSAEQILIAGEHISASAEDVSRAFTILSNLDVPGLGLESLDVLAIDETATNDDPGVPDDLALTDMLVIAHTALRPAAPRLERASLALAEVEPEHFPEEYREEVALAKEVVPSISQTVQQLLDLNETLITVLGHNESKRYLVIPHNNDEMRASMGFIGTFIIVDIHKGKVRNIEIPNGGPYDLLSDLRAQVIPPSYLHYVSTQWAMQDSNVWPDVPTSYQKLQWFYQMSGGSSVDGVIGLTPDVIEELLEAAGPVSMAEYYGTLAPNAELAVIEGADEAETDEDETLADTEAVPTGDKSGNPVISEILPNGDELIGDVVLDSEYLIDAENFRFVAQAQSERKFADTNDSKRFIADLTPRLLNQVFNDVDNFTPVLQTFFTSLSEKDLVFYFNDPFIQNEMKELGWTGEVKDAPLDYRQVVFDNVAGGKTDRSISTTVQDNVTITNDGEVYVETTITRQHTGSEEDPFTNLLNRGFLRLYTPEGSELLEVENDSFTPNPKTKLDIEDGYVVDEDLQRISGSRLVDEQTGVSINEEFNKTVFGIETGVAPGETSKTVFRYKLPFTLSIDGLLNPADSYSVLVQKQPGAFDALYKFNLDYPDAYSVRWSYPLQTGGEVTTTLNKDAFIGVVLEQ